MRGDGDGSRLCKALMEGDAAADIIVMFDNDQAQLAGAKRS